MNVTRSLVTGLALLAGSLATPPPASAQTARPSTPAPVSSPSEGEEQVYQLSDFAVRAGDEGYSVTDSVSGLRYRTNMLTLPKPINVATAEFIRDIGAQSLMDIIPYMTGSVPETVNGSSLVDVTQRFRGVSTNFVYRNGFRGFSPVDPISIERVEVVKGPSSFFGGQAQAGGFVNYVTKKPTGKKFSAFRQTFGSYNNLRTELETSGAWKLSEKYAIRYRAAAMYQDNDTFRDFEHQTKWSPFLSLDFRPFKNTQIAAEYQYIRREMNYGYGTPNFLILGPGAGNYVRHPLPMSFNPYGPGYDAYTGVSHTEVSIDQRITDWLSVRGALFQAQARQNLLLPTGVGNLITVNPTTGVRTISRNNVLHRTQHNNDRTARVDLLGQWSFSKANIKAYGGWERVYGKFSVTSFTSRANLLAAVNVDSPAFGVPATRADAIAGTVALANFYAIYDAFSAGAEVELFDRLNLFAGNRHDDGYPQKNIGGAPISPFKVDTPHYGFSFRITPNVALFANKSESFVPNQGNRVDGTLLDPLTGTGLDFGLKFSGFLDGRLAGLITIFDQDIKNNRLADPANPGFFITSGAFDNSKGVELDMTYNISKNWKTSFGYANIDSKTTASTIAGAIGIRPPNTPSHQANFLTRYSFSEGRLKGLSVILLGNYVGNRRSTSGATPDTPLNWIPGYTKFDVTVGYGKKLMGYDTNFRFAVRNVFDRFYYISTGGYGSMRTFEGSMQVRF